MAFKAFHSKILGSIALVAAAVLAAPAWADYPERPIRMIVPFPPGGGLDTVGRVVAEQLGKQLGQNVVVDNRGGASGVIGTAAAIRSQADGYTILFASSDTLTVLPLMKQLPFDVDKELRPIAKVADLYIVFAANPSVPVKTIQDVVKLSKEKPGSLRFASPGTGSVSHMTFEGFKLKTGTDVQHVPFNGGGPAQMAAIGGQIELLSGGANLHKQIAAGQLRGLSISSATRNPLLPDVPTLVESGVKDYVMSSWFGIFVPAQTPDAAVARLASALRSATQTEEFRTKVQGVGGTPTYLAGQDLLDHMKSESDKWKAVVDGAKIKLD